MIFRNKLFSGFLEPRGTFSVALKNKNCFCIKTNAFFPERETEKERKREKERKGERKGGERKYREMIGKKERERDKRERAREEGEREGKDIERRERDREKEEKEKSKEEREKKERHASLEFETLNLN